MKLWRNQAKQSEIKTKTQERPRKYTTDEERRNVHLQQMRDYKKKPENVEHYKQMTAFHNKKFAENNREYFKKYYQEHRDKPYYHHGKIRGGLKEKRIYYNHGETKDMETEVRA